MGLKEILGVKPRAEERSAITYSISDPAFAEFIQQAGSGIEVTESRALGIPGYYRGVSIVAGTIAGLPLKSYLDSGNGRKRVTTFLDKPAGPYPLTAFAWKELIMLHLLNQGETFLMHIYNNAGALIGLWPVHPNAVVKAYWEGSDKIFDVLMADGSKKSFDHYDMTHIMGLTLDGLRGVAPITLFRQSIKLGLAGELAATRSFTKGMMISGLVTPTEDITEPEAKAIKDGLQAKLGGVENSGDIAVVNRALTFSPWSMTNADAQFIESREFQVIEFARMLGVPPHLVGATEKQTSWGSGVAEQNLGLQKFTLNGWTTRIEEALSALLPTHRFCEFEFKELLKGTPEQEIKLLIEQVKAGLITIDEARGIMNMSPLPKTEIPTTDQGSEK